MKKNLIVVALILLIAVGVVFAEDQRENPVTAILTGTKDVTFIHGFFENQGETNNYQAEFEYEGNAFDSDPVFYYGFKTNATMYIESRMTITPFTNGDQKVKINAVKLGSTPADLIEPTSGQTFDPYYSILTYPGTGSGTTTREVKLTIVPDQTDIATAGGGTFTSEITVSIVSGA